jgi:hypothetical protein
MSRRRSIGDRVTAVLKRISPANSLAVLLTWGICVSPAQAQPDRARGVHSGASGVATFAGTNSIGEQAAQSQVLKVPLASLEILKIDPQPVRSQLEFSIVLRLINLRSQALAVRIVPKYIAGFTPYGSYQIQLPASGTVVTELKGAFAKAGSYTLTLDAQWRTNQLVVGGPPVYQQFAEDSKPVTVYDANAAPATPVIFDASPNEAPGTNGGSTASGVVGTIVGSQNQMFAIPKTAGVWRSTAGGPWVFLPGSPPRAFSIAVDPNRPSHLVVGERADDNDVVALGRSGVWESDSAGDYWTEIYDPAFDTQSQAVSAVTFAPKSPTLLFATKRGVARRTLINNIASFSYGRRIQANPDCHAQQVGPDLGAITALVAAQTRVWARSSSELFWSDDDGQNWSCWTFPATVDLPGAPASPADFKSGSNGGNDEQSLAAFDDRAYVIFNPNHSVTVPQSNPLSIIDARCDKTDTAAYMSGFDNCVIVGSVTGLLTFHSVTLRSTKAPFAPFIDQGYVAQYVGDGDGRGLNGKRFVKAFSASPAACPSMANTAIGSGRQIVVGHGQSIEQATAQDQSGRLVFDVPVGTQGSSNRGVGTISTFSIDANGNIVPRNNVTTAPDIGHPIHSDVWDLLIPTDFCTGTKASIFMANDGGIYRGADPAGGTTFTTFAWQTHSDGLHVSTAQDIAASLGGRQTTLSLQPGPNSKFLLGQFSFPTQDNDAWRQNSNGSWTVGGAGDMNYVAGDIGRPSSTLMWLHADDGTLLFGDQGDSSVGLVDSPSFDGPGAIAAVQTEAGESPPHNSLDLVMLVSLPLVDAKGNAIADPPGGTGTGARTALIRNTNYEASPNGPTSKFAGWQIVNDALPAGTTRFWLSGGHTNTQYFLLTDQSNSDCPNGLQHLAYAPPPLTRKAAPKWYCLVKNLAADSVGDADVHHQRGPAFVDPFNPAIIFVTTGSDIEMSENGGTDFCKLPVLTSLVTESGRYGIHGEYAPNAVFNALDSRFHGYALSIPSQISFDRADPNGASDSILVTSPYTGVYLGRAAPGRFSVESRSTPVNCAEEWKDVSPALPAPRGYVSSSVVNAGDAVISTEGRGILGIGHAGLAQLASYFETNASAAHASAIATLRSGTGSAVPWGLVLVTATNAQLGATTLSQSPVRVDGSGGLIVPSLPPGSYVIDLKFVGDGTIAPCAAKFALQAS